MATSIMKYLEKHSETFAKVGAWSAVAVLSITVGRAILTVAMENGHDLFTGGVAVAWKVLFVVLMGSSAVCLMATAVLMSASVSLYFRQEYRSEGKSNV